MLKGSETCILVTKCDRLFFEIGFGENQYNGHKIDDINDDNIS